MSTNSGGPGSRESVGASTAANNVNNDSSRKDSWAAVLGKSLISAAKKNVLEVVLEKNFKGSFTVSDLECAKFLCKIGLDTRSGADIEGVCMTQAVAAQCNVHCTTLPSVRVPLRMSASLLAMNSL